ncbi:MAG: hypothetical protein II207_01580 [Clostridia bacterium]|nr:hypothetical protein [Clostridia bacterium]
MKLEEIIKNKIMDIEKIKLLAVENADKRIKEVDKNSLSAIADYDRGLIEGFIDGYEIAINNIIKCFVDDYVKIKKELSKEDITAINTEEALNYGKTIKINKRLIHESFVGKVYIKEINGDVKL